MNNDIRKLFCEKDMIEKKLNNIKMEIMLSGCDKNKNDDNSKKNLESPSKKLVDMLKDVAVGTGLMLGGYRWGYGSLLFSVYGVGVIIMVVTGFLICVTTFCWFFINLFKVNYITNKKKECVVLVFSSIISIFLAFVIFKSQADTVNSEKSKENICNPIESKHG